MTITIILELVTFIVGGIIGWVIGAHNASSAKKQQQIIEDKIEDLKNTIITS